MTATAVAVLRDGALLALLMVAPVLVAALLAGVVTGLLGAFTQIQDPSVSLVPRIAAIAVALALFAPAIGDQIATFFGRLWPLVVGAGTG